MLINEGINTDIDNILKEKLNIVKLNIYKYRRLLITFVNNIEFYFFY